MPIGLQPNSPYTLFLIFILLLLSVDPQAEAKLAFLKSFLLTTRETVRTLQSGWEGWHAAMSEYFSTWGNR